MTLVTRHTSHVTRHTARIRITHHTPLSFTYPSCQVPPALTHYDSAAELCRRVNGCQMHQTTPYALSRRTCVLTRVQASNCRPRNFRGRARSVRKRVSAFPAAATKASPSPTPPHPTPIATRAPSSLNFPSTPPFTSILPELTERADEIRQSLLAVPALADPQVALHSHARVTSVVFLTLANRPYCDNPLTPSVSRSYRNFSPVLPRPAAEGRLVRGSEATLLLRRCLEA